ncbi:MAG: radical SAM protein [Patescibacteria group bacterium]|nr:radical SAM protein [Patescibacteria group bacterium]
MKVAIGYPPFDNPKGRAFLAQNRQFQWGTSPWTAYPVVPAYAASFLQEKGYEVYWLDGIWGMQTYAEWEKDLLEINPDVLMLETKTPVIKRHWEIIDRLKDITCPHSLAPGAAAKEAPGASPAGSGLSIVLVGDHVTALPEESMQNSKVDYILTGGDYDFLLLNLCNHLSKGEDLEPGIWYRKPAAGKAPGAGPALPAGRSAEAPGAEECSGSSPSADYSSTGHFVLNHDLNELPFIDRDLTQWELYAYQNSNYARTPGTYTMFGRDCWWGKCTFCSWTTLYPGEHFRVMSVERALDEVGHILENYPVREIMDDSGTFPVGEWLTDFCRGMIERGYNEKVRISCNMRFNAGLDKEDYELMREAGFRFLLYGLESYNQETLDRIQKNLKVEQIEPQLKWAKEAGLNPHPTAMVGYPWESKEEAKRTLNFAREMFKKGYSDTLQATIVTPYPGTPLFREAEEKGWLKTKDWDRYDMREPILKTEMSDEEIKGLVQGLYKSVLTPKFIARKAWEALTDWETFKYYFRMMRKFFSKLVDFR